MSKISFDKKNHLYYDDKGFVIPSVTYILDKVYGTGLEGAPLKFVEAASKIGTEVHEEIDKTIKTLKKNGTPVVWKAQTQAAIQWLHLNYDNFVDNCETEKIVSFLGPKPFAGTADLIYNRETLFDYKTSKTADKKQKYHWQMQLSFYYFALKMAGYPMQDMSVLHLVDDHCKEIPLEYLGDEFVLSTLEKFYAGIKEDIPSQPYSTTLQTLNQGDLQYFENSFKQLVRLEKSIEPIREAIKKEMEERNILSLKIGDVIINYVRPTKRKSFNTTKFKADYSELYDKYLKESDVKSSIRIKVNE